MHKWRLVHPGQLKSFNCRKLHNKCFGSGSGRIQTFGTGYGSKVRKLGKVTLYCSEGRMNVTISMIKIEYTIEGTRIHTYIFGLTLFRTVCKFGSRSWQKSSGSATPGVSGWLYWTKNTCRFRSRRSHQTLIAMSFIFTRAFHLHDGTNMRRKIWNFHYWTITSTIMVLGIFMIDP
jgi:hypothetical protein